MEADLDKIAKRENMNRKDAMIAMNDLKKQLEERRDQLGSSEQMRRALSQMKGIEAGPGEKVAKSIEQGNFGQAKEAVKQLASKMRDGKLSEKEKEQLKKQVEQMKQALQKAVKEHEQKKQEARSHCSPYHDDRSRCTRPAASRWLSELATSTGTHHDRRVRGMRQDRGRE